MPRMLVSPFVWAHDTGAGRATNIPKAFYNRGQDQLGKGLFMKTFCTGLARSARFAGVGVWVTTAASVVLLLAAGSAHALGVDCNKITNPDENTICSEVSLAKMDNDL